MYKDISLHEALDAIEKNGFPKVQGSFVTRQEINGAFVTVGCAIGQGSLNLKCDPSDLRSFLDDFNLPDRDEDGYLTSLGDWIIEQNDGTEAEVSDIGHRAKEMFKDHSYYDKPIRSIYVQSDYAE